MRVTNNSFSQGFLDQVNKLTSRQYRLQNQVATGQKVRDVSDDPGAMGRILVLKAESAATSQYQQNIDRQKEISTANFAVVKTLKKISDRAGEIAILSDGLKSPDELKIYAIEVGELIKQAVQVANTKNRGDYLLGGTKTDRQPFVATTGLDGTVDSVTYEGSDRVVENEIAEGVVISAQTLGESTDPNGPAGLLADSRTGANFFKHLISLHQNLIAGDTNAIATTDRVNLAKDEDNLLLHIGMNGALQARLESTLADSRNTIGKVSEQISSEMDADMADTLMKLNETQVAYQAALQGGARIMQTSLLDFLR